MLVVVQVSPTHYKLVSKTARKLLGIRGVLLFGGRVRGHMADSDTYRTIDDVRISKRVEGLAKMDSEVIK